MRCFAFLGAVLTAAASCFGDPMSVAETRVNVGSWAFAPIVSTDNAGQKHVHSFLALKNKNYAQGQNLVSVWYERPSIASNQWKSTAWTSLDQWDAIKTVKIALSIPNSFDFAWPTSDPNSGAPPGDTGSEYYKGLLASDPYAAVLENSVDHDLWIDLLTAVGYKAADVTFDKSFTAACSQKGWLDTMADSVEWNLNATIKSEAPGNNNFINFADSCFAADPSLLAVTDIVSDWDGVWTCTPPNGITPPWDQGENIGGQCKYTRCQLCEEKRIVSLIDNWGVKRCYYERRWKESCEVKQTNCAPLPNGTCPNPVSACPSLVPGPFTPTEYHAPSMPIRDSTPITCP